MGKQKKDQIDEMSSEELDNTQEETQEEVMDKQEEIATEETVAENTNTEQEPYDVWGETDTEPIDEETEKLRQELGESKDKFLRLYAEFDNFKKRSAKERIETMQTAGKDVILDILPVLDDFERAFQTNIAENEADHNEGFHLIYNKLKRILESKGVTPMNAKGQTFDSELHSAVTEIDAGPDQKGMVVDVIEEGYYMNDKIIRHAKVVVGR